MTVTRKPLFESETLHIGLFEARPESDACGDVERQTQNAMVLPLSGVFSKHDGPGRYIVGTPSHAVFFAADAPYRIGYPGAVGDRALSFRFSEALAPEHVRGFRRAGPLHGLLPPKAMMLRNLLRARLATGGADPFEVEALGLELLHVSLRSIRTGQPPVRRATLARRLRALERVKEAVAVAPAEKWSVAALAQVAEVSPFHLCHVFRQMVGTSIHDYVLHERLAHALDAVLERGHDLTAIALDAGFSSHSHFTARFRNFFGHTPAALRRIATSAHARELRKIVTARRRKPALD